MRKGIQFGILKSIVALLALSATYASRADAYVEVTWLGGLFPSSVTISEGEYVFWYDGDEDGPYYITFNGISWYETPFSLQFLQAGYYEYHDDLGDYGSVNVNVSAPNTPPTVTITNPVDNAIFTAPATVVFEADAYDPDPYPNELWDVEFWVNDELVDDVFDPPFSTTVTDLGPGTYTLKAIAWDWAYTTGTNAITITVVDAPITLTAPAVVGSNFRFDATGLVSGRPTVLQASTNPASASSWISLSTNTPAGSTASFTNAVTTTSRCYRIVQMP